MEDKNKQVADKIKSIRIAKNIGQNELAQKLNMTTPTYNRIENNKTQITITILFEIAKALDIEVAAMLDIGANNIVHNNDNVVMTNFNHGNLHINVIPDELKKHFANKNN
ncbi:MAG: XRE family transcriptional regulator [Chitinophagaceae bacterium]|nr:MAG: XRE family transcriptional regulator [Chitinophagaceae bacterium]